jgi:hypothetical protein
MAAEKAQDTSAHEQIVKEIFEQRVEFVRVISAVKSDAALQINVGFVFLMRAAL